jgi:hypothetical protein
MFSFRQLVAKYMREVADKIEVGTSEISESEAIEILRIVAHESMSKAQACQYLNMQPNRFDEYVRANRLPKGRKKTGFKEKTWYKDELDIAVSKIKRRK